MRQTEWQAAPLLIGLTQPLFQFNALRWERRTEPLRFQVAQPLAGQQRREQHDQ